MGSKFFIIVPFYNDFEPSSGSTIRIAGYTKSLIELNIDFKFLSSVRPRYVPPERHEFIKMNKRWTKIFLIHNLTYSSIILRPLSFLLRIFIKYQSGIDEVSKKVEDRIIWSHQDNTLAMYFYIVYGLTFIYDVHGFFDIQKEYREDLGVFKKIWFDLYLKHEREVLRSAPFINVVSNYMKKYVETTFVPKGKVLIAPDGYLGSLNKCFERGLQNNFRERNAISENDKVIVFAGSFKKIGGVTELVKVFINNEKIFSSAVLVLIGNGQEEKQIYKLLASCKCSDRVFRIKSMPHRELIQFMTTIDVVVCPDISGNLYNEMTPHIKLFDAIASGKNVVATDFKVNKEIFAPHAYNIFYFSYDKENSFRDAIYQALESQRKAMNYSILEKHTYLENTKEYLKNFI